MSRLTWKKENGEWGLKGYDIKKVPRELYGYMCKLKDYEENDCNDDVRHVGRPVPLRLRETADQRSGIGQVNRPCLQRGERVSLFVEGSGLEGVEIRQSPRWKERGNRSDAADGRRGDGLGQSEEM